MFTRITPTNSIVTDRNGFLGVDNLIDREDWAALGAGEASGARAGRGEIFQSINL